MHPHRSESFVLAVYLNTQEIHLLPHFFQCRFSLAGVKVWVSDDGFVEIGLRFKIMDVEWGTHSRFYASAKAQIPAHLLRFQDCSDGRRVLPINRAD
jgi:hypothetical protein